MGAVSKEVIIGGPAHDLRQALAELAIQKAHHFSHSLQRKAFAPQLTDHRHLGEVVHRIQATMALPGRLYPPALIPPLELAGRDPRQGDYLSRCKTIWHESSIMFETI